MMTTAATIPPIAPPDTPPPLVSAAADGVAEGEIALVAEGLDVTINGGTTGVGAIELIAESEADVGAILGLGLAEDAFEVGLAEEVGCLLVALDVGLLLNLSLGSVSTAALAAFLVVVGVAIKFHLLKPFSKFISSGK